jgi:hypothetical protein
MLSSIHIQKSRGKVPEIQDHTEICYILLYLEVKFTIYRALFQQGNKIAIGKVSTDISIYYLPNICLCIIIHHSIINSLQVLWRLSIIMT